MNNPARKHHFIPVFYSRRWAGGRDGQVQRFTRPHGKVVSRRVSPERVGWAHDLYRGPEDEPGRETLEEHFFKRLDDAAAKALRVLGQQTGRIVAHEAKSVWTYFLLSLLHRTPSAMLAQSAAAYRIWPDIAEKVRDHYGELRREHDPATIDEYIALHHEQDARASVFRNLPSLITRERMATYLYNANWIIREVPLGHQGLVLSDQALARTNGVREPNGHLAMPLSPRRLLVMTEHANIAAQMESWPIGDLVRGMNRWAVESAEHFVVAESEAQASLIQNYFGTALKRPLADAVGRRN